MSSFVIPRSFKGEAKLSREKGQLDFQKVLSLITKDLNIDEYSAGKLTNFTIPVKITARFLGGALLDSQSLDHKSENILNKIKKVIIQNKISFVKENYILINKNKILTFLLKNKDILFFLESLPDVLINYFDKKRKLSLEVRKEFETGEEILIILINTSDLTVDSAFQYLMDFKSDFLLKKDNDFLRRIHINAT
ncbi:hypothetical protein DFR79_10110 [Halanaerobium saccharolyticum]|uniref:Uncharacterized protein n=1 Tax=Halanaerobium saccharolyticum TaxID=43595 RepID=A0A4R6M311_9FIRM|nr:hypothetical protein [Halanaerobium saccharolyticum]TDO95015.1 hypothetical protein DFR79_10110 [Halanaerobium saccharolyticum]